MSKRQRRYAVILNPHAGGGRAPRTLREVASVFGEANVTLEIAATEDAGHARELARDLPADGLDAVCVFGGDGTVHEVVNGLMNRPDPRAIPLGIVPAGSGNSMAQQLYPDACDAARSLVDPRAQALDLIRLDFATHHLYSFNIVGWAMAHEGGHRAETLRWIGSRRYLMAGLLTALRGRRYSATLHFDGGEEMAGEFAFVMVCNTQYTGTSMRVAPRARLDDGLIDVVVVGALGRPRLLKLLGRLLDGTHIDEPEVHYRQVEWLRLEAAQPGGLNVDGEITGKTPVEMRVVPGALRLLV